MKLQMELLVWVGDFGLASLSVECLRAIIYIKLTDAPVSVYYSRNPYFCFYLDYPVFRHGNIILTDFTDMINYLRMRNYSVNYSLSGKQTSDAYAVANLLSVHLRPLLYYVIWLDKRNYEELINPWYSKVMLIPFNILYTRKKKKYARCLMETLYPEEEDLNIIEQSLFRNATECYSCLSARLGQQDFFHGNQPTSLDAVVYAYLAPLMKIPFPSDQVTKLLDNFAELQNYVKRVDHLIFPDIVYESKYIKAFARPSRDAVKDEDEYATNWRTKIFVCMATGVAMFGYAISKNLVDMNKLRDVVVGE